MNLHCGSGKSVQIVSGHSISATDIINAACGVCTGQATGEPIYRELSMTNSNTNTKLIWTQGIINWTYSYDNAVTLSVETLLQRIITNYLWSRLPSSPIPNLMDNFNILNCSSEFDVYIQFVKVSPLLRDYLSLDIQHLFQPLNTPELRINNKTTERNTEARLKL